ncbi:MAG: DUF4340 domain-containing protein [Gammaproteobacteria bacterium]|nr:DUF4340 domain-containing protein [Gammaproteobacteria bacterium]MCP5136725.1 DUF4340 domain-containing protein [Gammaproteobacteria bacterium]
MNGFRLNLLLLAVVLTLGSLLWLDHRPPPETIQRLTPLQAEAVRSLRIERQAQEAVVLERNETGWHMRYPWSVRADAERVRRLLGLLSQRSDVTYPLADVDPARLGLMPPRATLVVDGMPIGFGDSEPLNRRRYVRVDDRVHLLEDRYFYQLNSRAADFVSPNPLPSDSRIEMLRLPNLTLTRGADGWQVEPAMDPETHSADAPQMLVDAWQMASAAGVKAAQSGDSDESIEIRLRGMAEPRRFSLRRDAEGFDLIDVGLGLVWRFGKFAADGLLKLREIASDA